MGAVYIPTSRFGSLESPVDMTLVSGEKEKRSVNIHPKTLTVDQVTATPPTSGVPWRVYILDTWLRILSRRYRVPKSMQYKSH